jgi:hypothetical protein
MDDELKQIRTYQGDVAEALKDQSESLVSIRRAELVKQGEGNEFAPRKTPEEEAERKSREKIILLIVGTVLLLILGGVGVWYAYIGYQTKTALPAVVIIPNKFISSETSFDLNVSGLARDSFLSTFDVERTKEIKNGNIEQIQLKKNSTSTPLISTGEFLNILNTKAPDSLVRAFDPLFMLGVIGDTTEASSTPHTFLIIKLDSFDNAYAGMLSWENNLQDDLLPLFASADIVASTTSNIAFQDITIQNKDARAIKDTNGNTILLYSFFDNNMLIITDNESSLRSLVIRLNTEKLSR